MMKKITLLFAFLTMSIGFSQEVIQSFEAAGAVGAEFGNMAAPAVVTDGGTNGTQVLEIVGNPSGEIWQGVNLNLTKNVDLTSSKTMTIDVKSDTPITFLVKVNGGIAGAPEAAAEVTHNGDGTWQTLSFTFNTSLDGKAAQANGVYSSFVIHAFWKAGETTFAPNVTTDSRTFYVDNISGIAAAPVVDPAPTVAAPTPPARNPSDVYSLFSDAYAARTVENWNASWDAATSSDVLIQSNATKKVTGLGYLGVEFINNRIDVSAYTNFHIDIWTATATLDKSFNLKFSNWNAGAAEANAIEFSTTNASNPALPNPNPGTWISLDMPLSAWTAGARNDVAQFIITSDLGDVYFDNLYLYKGTALGTKDFAIEGLKVYPNPAQDRWTVSTKNIKMTSIQVFDILGKNVVSLQPNTSEVKINATNLKSGLYFAKVSTNNGSSTLKLVKQ